MTSNLNFMSHIDLHTIAIGSGNEGLSRKKSSGKMSAPVRAKKEKELSLCCDIDRRSLLVG